MMQAVLSLTDYKAFVGDDKFNCTEFNDYFELYWKCYINNLDGAPSLEEYTSLIGGKEKLIVEEYLRLLHMLLQQFESMNTTTPGPTSELKKSYAAVVAGGGSGSGSPRNSTFSMPFVQKKLVDRTSLSNSKRTPTTTVLNSLVKKGGPASSSTKVSVVLFFFSSAQRKTIYFFLHLIHIRKS